MLLQDVQQEGSLRQVFRQQRNQTPFSVNLDEFYTFADVAVIDSLNGAKVSKHDERLDARRVGLAGL